jgi:hypothetical protein
MTGTSKWFGPRFVIGQFDARGVNATRLFCWGFCKKASGATQFDAVVLPRRFGLNYNPSARRVLYESFSHVGLWPTFRYLLSVSRVLRLAPARRVAGKCSGLRAKEISHGTG